MGEIQLTTQPNGPLDLDLDIDNLDLVFQNIPRNIFSEDEISREMVGEFFQEIAKIQGYYKEYYKGAPFYNASNGDFIPSSLRYKKIKYLIDQEARFMFAKPPDIIISADDDEITDALKKKSTTITKYVNKVLEKNMFNSKLIRAAKDCFIAGRICLVLNFDDDGIEVDFVNATEFYYEYDGPELAKLILFYHLNTSLQASVQRIKKKCYFLEEDENGNKSCTITETMYDGSGFVIEPEQAIETDFEYIPCFVVFNDGLSGEFVGESEVDEIDDYESVISKISNADLDALRKSMNGIRYTIDMAPGSTKSLPDGPGAYWDLQTTEDSAEKRNGSVGLLEPSMSYGEGLKNTLERLDNTLHAQLSIPNINSEKLQGMITSGKTIKALYWPLIVRCDEKALVWKHALKRMVESIIECSIDMPEIAEIYTDDKLSDYEFNVSIENNYPLPEDEEEEKNVDLMEVQNQVMSRKTYMKKWRKLTDAEVDQELMQIALETQMLENASFDTNAFGAANPYVMTDNQLPEQDASEGQPVDDIGENEQGQDESSTNDQKSNTGQNKGSKNN